MQDVINDDIRDDILPTFLSRWPLLLFFLSKLWVAATLRAIITSFLVAFELDPYNAYAFTTPLLRPY